MIRMKTITLGKAYARSPLQLSSLNLNILILYVILSQFSPLPRDKLQLYNMNMGQYQGPSGLGANFN